MPTKKVLIVDDSATSRFRSSVILRKTNHQILTARDGEEGVEKAIAEGPDLILMDVEMPKMNGFEACRQLRQLAETRLTPIIMVTSRSEAEYVENGRRSGCNDYVIKPVEGPELLEKINHHIGL